MLSLRQTGNEKSEARTFERVIELPVANRAKHFTRAAHMEGETQSLKQDRDLVKQAWKSEIARSKAMKELLHSGSAHGGRDAKPETGQRLGEESEV
jgi:hypothetical protein